MSRVVIGFLKFTILAIILMTFDRSEAQGLLKMGFYRTTCPTAEQIVRDTVNKAVMANPGMAAGIIRLYFHDCFVRGCDASLLLKPVRGSEGESEQDSFANAGTLRGLEIIDQAKARLEATCPNTVSCADILAFAARDSTYMVGGFSYDIPSGRRDGRVSNINDVHLPGPDSHLDTLISSFVEKGLSVRDLVALSGAHSIGRAGCNSIVSRLYSFNGNGTDPSLDPKYAKILKRKCPERPLSRKTELDLVTPNRLDNQYYRNIKQQRVPFSSDEALVDSTITAKMVTNYAKNPNAWRKDFAAAMVRLGSLDVLTGTRGEIRKKCGVVN
ncbi:putative peroxidase [Helianthus annuus]|nr:putative peroxidase [Helianthus annuus]KAJ0640977.1 putative peroxidase [Helianthus annuus]KAJ0644896.1 putative peroxidase [Helianthus annuus]KAJ0821312.1 putative peroxidase [Helianthus annuus]KAJ0835967.1 putative peroxidase [Helianthus annuus]